MHGQKALWLTITEEVALYYVMQEKLLYVHYVLILQQHVSQI